MDPMLYLAAINALAFFLYWIDKRAAKRPGSARVPEATLLLAGFLGGTVAAFVAQRVLRHKNRKRSFQVKFWLITLVQVGLLLVPPPVVQKILAGLFR